MPPQNSFEKDIVWQTALDWVMREQDGPLDNLNAKLLSDWLKENNLHLAAHEDCKQLWLASGLVILNK